MTKSAQKAKDYLTLFINRIFTFFLVKLSLTLSRWIFLMIGYQKLSSNDFSILAATFSIIEILKIISEFGSESLIYSRLSSNKNFSIISGSLINLRVLISIMLAVTCAVISAIFEHHNVSILFVLIPIYAIQSSNFAFMQKNRDIKKIITIITITFIALFVSIMGLRTPVITLRAICIFFIIPDFITTIVATLYNKYEWKLILRNFNHSYYKTHKSLKVLAPLGFVSALVIIYSRLDILIALPILGSELQSKYSFGFRFTEPFSMLLGILSISFIAEMANIKNINVLEYYSRIYKKIFSIKFLCVGFVINLFLAISLALFANYYFKFNEILLVFILSMSMGIKFINSFLSSFFIRKTLYVDLLKITSVVSIVIFVCSWQLSISHGIIGIAIATLFGETLNLILQKDFLNKFFKKHESI